MVGSVPILGGFWLETEADNLGVVAALAVSLGESWNDGQAVHGSPCWPIGPQPQARFS